MYLSQGNVAQIWLLSSLELRQVLLLMVNNLNLNPFSFEIKGVRPPLGPQTPHTNPLCSLRKAFSSSITLIQSISLY